MKHKIAIAGAVLILLMVYLAFSRHNARVACDHSLGNQIRDMPHHATRLVVFPSQHLATGHRLPPRLGWVVSYSNTRGYLAVGFLVSMAGTIIETGSPLDVPAVAQLHEQLTQFLERVARVDAQLKPGMSIRNAVSTVGPPDAVQTNGVQVTANYWFGFPPLFVGQITNGFVVAFSNGVLVGKFPILMGSG